MNTTGIPVFQYCTWDALNAPRLLTRIVSAPSLERVDISFFHWLLLLQDPEVLLSQDGKLLAAFSFKGLHLTDTFTVIVGDRGA